jgi:hypothetical protein
MRERGGFGGGIVGSLGSIWAGVAERLAVDKTSLSIA